MDFCPAIELENFLEWNGREGIYHQRGVLCDERRDCILRPTITSYDLTRCWEVLSFWGPTLHFRALDIDTHIPACIPCTWEDVQHDSTTGDRGTLSFQRFSGFKNPSCFPCLCCQRWISWFELPHGLTRIELRVSVDGDPSRTGRNWQ